jgi:hypothetical protein
MKNHFYLSVVLLFFFTASVSAQTTWQELGPDNVGANVSSLIVDNRDPTGNTLYAGTQGGGVWKSTSAGNWWEPLGCTDNMYVSSIVQANDGKIYFGTGYDKSFGIYGSSLYKSAIGEGVFAIDSSDNFQALGYSDTLLYKVIVKMAVNPTNSNELLIATDRGLLQSKDKGQTWSKLVIPGVAVNANYVDVTWASDGLKIYASYNISSNSGFVRSLDGGLSWEQVSNANYPSFPVTSGRIGIGVSPANPSRVAIYLANSSGGTISLIVSNDAGNTWNTLAVKDSTFNPDLNEGCAWAFNSLTFHPTELDKIFVASKTVFTLDNVYGSQNKSIFSGNLLAPGEGIYINQIVVDTTKDVIYVCSIKGIFQASTATNYPNLLFSEKDQNITTNNFLSVTANKMGVAYGGNDNNRFYQQNLYTKNFNSLRKLNAPTFCEVSTLSNNFVFISDMYARFLTSDNSGNVFTNLFDLNLDPENTNTPSACGSLVQLSAPYISTFVLKETKAAFNNREQVNFTADKQYNAGDSIIVQSKTAKTKFTITTPISLNQGDVLPVPDQVVSRLFLSSKCGVWMKAHALNIISNRDWFRVLPASSVYGEPFWYETSNNMDTLYVTTSIGYVIKIAGLNSLDYSDNTDVYKDDSLTITSVKIKHRLFEGLAIDRQNNQVLICALTGILQSADASVYKSTDGGSTWQPLLNGPMGVAAYTCLIDENNSNTYLVGTQNGLWVSYDAGQTWQHEVSELCQIPVFRLRQTPLLVDECPVVYAATSRGLWRSFSLTPNGCNTSVGITPITTEGTDFVVYPNPTAGQLHLKSIMQNAGEAAIQITDISGRLIVQTKMDYVTGEQIYKLDISAFASGMYFATLVTNDRRSTKMFVVE